MAILIDQAISGTGSVSLGGISSVDHATVNLTVHGALVGLHTAGPADSVIRAGFVAFGWAFAAEGSQAAGTYWDPPTWLGFDQEVVTPPLGQRNYTHVRYWLSPGTSGRLLVVGQTAVSLVPSSVLAPWDRNLAAFQRNWSSNITPGGGTIQVGTYTVPSARRLWLARATVRVDHYAAPSAAVQCLIQMILDSVVLLQAEMRSAAVSNPIHDDLSAGPLILAAGQVIQTTVLNQDTGGGALFMSELSGFLFDA